MLKKVIIYIEPDEYTLPNILERWNDKFIQEIIKQELDSLSGYGTVKGYTIEDIPDA